jgi:predicted AlkP superfamily phosphohydrolase/phosphomutase
LPHFKRLLHQGASGPLRSTIHPLSPQAWSTFITGKNAGKHGLYDFLVKKPGSYQFALTHGGHRQGLSLWRLLSEAGKKVIVVNVPFTYPPEPVNGIMISGFDAPRSDASLSYPPDLCREITAAVGGYYLHEMYPVGRRKAEYEEVLRNEIENRVKVTKHLIRNHDWDFLAVVVNATDLVQHLFWAEMEDPASPYRDIVRHVYQAVDAAVGEFWSMLGDDVTLLIVSDHGAGPIRKSIYLNEWLHRQGWLAFHPQESSPGRQAATRLVDRGRVLMKRSLPRPLKDWLKQHLSRFRNQVESWLQTSDIDWAHTQAFAGGNFGNIYINLRGREPEGIVAPGAEYEELVNRIVAALKQLRDPETGELLVQDVHRREALYQGPYLEIAPDLVVEWREYAYYAFPSLGGSSGQVFAPPPQEDATEFDHSGTHRVDGILLATGPGIRPGAVEGARIADLAPTILHAFGLPVPEDMDGRVLDTLLAEQRPVAFAAAPQDGVAAGGGPAYTDQESEDVAERLRALGYMD